jgi:hypothetical protein
MEDRSGYVYLLKAHKPFEECYKIGRTKDPKRRFHDFGVKLPYRIEVLAVMSARDMFRGEAILHSTFASRRVEGEWFRLSREDVSWMEALRLVVQAEDLVYRLRFDDDEWEPLRLSDPAQRGYVKRRSATFTRAMGRMRLCLITP